MPVHVTASTVNPGSTISITFTGSDASTAVSETASIIAGPPVSTSGGSQPGGAASTLASAVTSNAGPSETSVALSKDSSVDASTDSVAATTTKTTGAHTNTKDSSSLAISTGAHTWTPEDKITAGAPTASATLKVTNTVTSDKPKSTTNSILPLVVAKTPDHARRDYREPGHGDGDANGRYRNDPDHYNKEEHYWSGWPHRQPDRYQPEYHHNPSQEHPDHDRPNDGPWYKPNDESCHDKPHRDHPDRTPSSPTSTGSATSSWTSSGAMSQAATPIVPSIMVTGSSSPSKTASRLPSAMLSDSSSMQGPAQPSGAASNLSTGLDQTSARGTPTKSKSILTKQSKTSGPAAVSTA